MYNSGTTTAISKNIPESEKDEKYHKYWHDAILRSGNLSIASLDRIKKNYAYYRGSYLPEEEFNFLMVADNGVRLPIEHDPMRESLGFIEWMLGDLADRPIKVSAQASSPKALDRKHDGIASLETDFKLSPWLKRMENMTGFPTIDQDAPKTAEDLDKAKRNYKEKGEIITDRMIRDFYDRTDFNSIQRKLFEHSKVAGICHFGLEVVNGWPQPVIYQPDDVLVDCRGDDPLFRNETVKAVVQYTPLSLLTYKYQLSRDEIKELENHKTPMFIAGWGNKTAKSYPHMISDKGETLVLETKVYWLDNKKLDGQKYNKNGREHHRIHEYDFRGKIKKSKLKYMTDSHQFDVEQIRYCCVLGNKIVKDFGLLPNQYTTYDSSWVKTRFPILSFAPRFKDGELLSDIDLLWPADKLAQEALYQIQKAMKKDRGKANLIDTAQLPEDLDMLDIPWLSEWYGILPINSGKYAINSNFNQYQTLDQSISPSVKYYLELYMFAIENMKRVVGIADNLRGVARGDEAASLFQQQVAQSSIRSSFGYKWFSSYIQRIIDAVIREYSHYMLKDAEKFGHVIGSDGIRFLQQNPDFPMETYGIYVTSNYGDKDKLIQIRETVQAAVMNQGLPLDVALDITFQEDPKEALAIMEREMEKARQRAEQQAKQAQEFEAQQAQMQMQQQSQMQMQMIQMQEQMKNSDRSHAKEMEQLKAILEMKIMQMEMSSKAGISSQQKQEEARAALEQLRMSTATQRDIAMLNNMSKEKIANQKAEVDQMQIKQQQKYTDK